MGGCCFDRAEIGSGGFAGRRGARMIAVMAAGTLLGAMIGGCAGKSGPAEAGGSTGGPMGGSAGTASAGSVAAVNDRCPIMDEHPVSKRLDPDLSRRFKGELVGFCCDDCPAAWDALSDQEKAATLAKVRRR
jgi:hypothetical protein